MKPDLRSIAEMRTTLQRIVDGTDGVYEIDDFFSVAFDDPKLESLRHQLLDLPDRFPPETKNRFCGPAGINIIRGWIEDLSHDNMAQTPL